MWKTETPSSSSNIPPGPIIPSVLSLLTFREVMRFPSINDLISAAMNHTPDNLNKQFKVATHHIGD